MPPKWSLFLSNLEKAGSRDPRTNSRLPLKIDAWKMIPFLLGQIGLIFRDKLAVSFREGIFQVCLPGWCSTPTLLLICSSFSRENGHPLLICSSLSTGQLRLPSSLRPWYWQFILIVNPKAPSPPMETPLTLQTWHPETGLQTVLTPHDIPRILREVCIFPGFLPPNKS